MIAVPDCESNEITLEARAMLDLAAGVRLCSAAAMVKHSNMTDVACQQDYAYLDVLAGRTLQRALLCRHVPEQRQRAERPADRYEQPTSRARGTAYPVKTGPTHAPLPVSLGRAGERPTRRLSRRVYKRDPVREWLLHSPAAFWLAISLFAIVSGVAVALLVG